MARPRKQNVERNADGKPKYPRKEREADAMSVALSARKRHLGARDFTYRGDDGRERKIAANDPLWGFSLGRLLIADMSDDNGIDRDQFDTGMRWMVIDAAHTRRNTLVAKHVSPAALLVARAMYRDLVPLDADDEVSSDDRSEDEKDVAVKRQFSEAYLAVMEHSQFHGTPTPWQMLVRVVRDGEMPTSPIELGNLRIALNVLAHVWRRK